MLSVGADARPRLTPLAVVVAAFGLMLLGVVSSAPMVLVAPAAALMALLGAGHRVLLRWQALLAGLLLVILFIPIRRYEFPGNLPFQLEPYRLYVLLLGAAWFSSLLIDSRIRARASGLEGPFTVIGVAILGSIVVNSGRIHADGLTTDVVKKTTFFVSFVVVFYVVVSVVRRLEDADPLVKILVAGGAVLGVLGIIEARIEYNPFDHLSDFLPFLDLAEPPLRDSRGGQVRAYASAQHPIAFGALLAMILPLSIYVARKERRPGWWAAAGIIGIGAVTSVSRTSIVMLLVIGLVFLLLRPASVKKLWPALVPAVLAVHFVLPGTLGTVHDLFFPKEGLIAAQSNAPAGSSRINSLGPALDEVADHPVLGQGYGTRIPEGPRRNTIIVDDQWLDTLLETGVIGFIGWLWLFIRYGRTLNREARKDHSHRGWLLVALSASVSSFAVAMAFYDAFSFIQVTLLMFVYLGIGMALVGVPARRAATSPALHEATAARS
jgi:hypothetical protein